MEIVGIPGAGKTYYLSKIQESEAISIDFGIELKRWLKETNKRYEGTLPPNAYVEEFIDTLKPKDIPTIITSHIVHYKNGKSFYDLDCERYAKASAYIFIYSTPEDIFSRRQADNENNIRKRNIGSTEKIEEHQKVSLEVTKKLSEELGSHLLILENIFGNEEKNLLKIKNLLRGLKNE